MCIIHREFENNNKTQAIKLCHGINCKDASSFLEMLKDKSDVHLKINEEWYYYCCCQCLPDKYNYSHFIVSIVRWWSEWQCQNQNSVFWDWKISVFSRFPAWLPKSLSDVGCLGVLIFNLSFMCRISYPKHYWLWGSDHFLLWDYSVHWRIFSSIHDSTH